MNVVVIFISTQITRLKPTSQVVYQTYTLKVSIPLRILLPHLSILKTLLRQHSVGTINQFFLEVFPQKSFRQLRHLQRKILIYKCF